MNILIEFVRHPRARRYIIRVRRDGTVRVTMPRWGSRRAAQAFAEQEQSWIERQRRKVHEEQVTVPAAYPPEIVAALRVRAKKELPPELLELAARHGLPVARVSVRNQRWRWGSCSPNGHICLNWRLVLVPDFVRHYVFVHELMHLKRLDHSAAFWRLVVKAFPRTDEARRWLRENAALLRD